METIPTSACCRATDCVFCLVDAEVEDAIVVEVEGTRKTLHRYSSTSYGGGRATRVCSARERVGWRARVRRRVEFFRELGADCAMREGASIRLDLLTA